MAALESFVYLSVTVIVDAIASFGSWQSESAAYPPLTLFACLHASAANAYVDLPKIAWVAEAFLILLAVADELVVDLAVAVVVETVTRLWLGLDLIKAWTP